MAQFPSPALDVMPPPSHSSGIPRGDLEAFLHRLLTAPLGCLCTCPTGTDTCRRRVPIRDLPTYRDHHGTSSPWSPVTGHRGCSWPPAARLHQEPFAPTSCRTHTSHTAPSSACPGTFAVPCNQSTASPRGRADPQQAEAGCPEQLPAGAAGLQTSSTQSPTPYSAPTGSGHCLKAAPRCSAHPPGGDKRAARTQFSSQMGTGRPENTSCLRSLGKAVEAEHRRKYHQLQPET